MRELIAIALAVSLAGCKPDEPPGAPPEAPGEDAAASIDAESGAAESDVAELAGMWRGEVDTDEYGRVRAVAHVSPQGDVSYEVVGKQPIHHYQFRIESWDGKTIRARDSQGNTYQLAARLDGDTLALDVPTVGRVELERTGGGR